MSPYSHAWSCTTHQEVGRSSFPHQVYVMQLSSLNTLPGPRDLSRTLLWLIITPAKPEKTSSPLFLSMMLGAQPCFSPGSTLAEV